MLTVDVFCRFSCKASGVTFTILGQELSIYGSQPDFMDWHSVSKLHLKKIKILNQYIIFSSLLSQRIHVEVLNCTGWQYALSISQLFRNFVCFV